MMIEGQLEAQHRALVEKYRTDAKEVRLGWDILDVFCKIAEWFPYNEYDGVIGIATGGIIPATVLSIYLEIPLFLVDAKSYANRKKLDTITFKNVTLPEDIAGKKYILADDIFDSGRTLETAKAWLEARGAKGIAMTLVTKGKTFKETGIPSLLEFMADQWVCFPWEKT